MVRDTKDMWFPITSNQSNLFPAGHLSKVAQGLSARLRRRKMEYGADDAVEGTTKYIVWLGNSHVSMTCTGTFYIKQLD